MSPSSLEPSRNNLVQRVKVVSDLFVVTSGADLTVNYTSRPGQQTVFARLQSLFPAPPGAPALPSFPQNELQFPLAKLQSSRKHPKFLKIRILTWNMHDSLPKVRMKRNCSPKFSYIGA
jgi:hypothetical protein